MTKKMLELLGVAKGIYPPPSSLNMLMGTLPAIPSQGYSIFAKLGPE